MADKNKSIILIPARLESTRLPEKMLLQDTGKALIHHTYDQARKAVNHDDIVGCHIVTDSRKIMNYCLKHNISYIPSDPAKSGTERVLKVASRFYKDCNVINVQGDCPYINPSLIQQLHRTCGNHLFSKTIDIVTAHYLTRDRKIGHDPNRVKCVTNMLNQAMYYSRSPIPYNTNVYKIHVGIYAFKKDIVDRLVKIYLLNPTDLFTSENLEQLRWLYGKIRVRSITTSEQSSIDTQEDYDKFVSTDKKSKCSRCR